MFAIEIFRLTKTFADGRRALDNVEIRVRPGEMVALIGASGSGKSTLLRHLSGLVAADRCENGTIRVHGNLIQQHGRVARDIRRLRGEIGFVFQQFNLVGRLSVLTNVLTGSLRRIPSWRSITGLFPREERALAAEALERMGLGQRQLQRASTLSGGQQQRAAIARALVQRARVLLADEPIASLDPDSCKRVMDSLRRVNREDGITVLVSLHQVDYATAYCPRVVGLREGRVVYDGPSAALTPEILGRIYGGELEAATAVTPGAVTMPAPHSLPTPVTVPQLAAVAG